MNVYATSRVERLARAGLAAAIVWTVAWGTVVPVLGQAYQTKLTGADGGNGNGDQFGISVAIDGDTAVVGSWLDENGPLGNAGSAYIFVRAGGVWTQQARLTASDSASGDQFGISVAISNDTVVVGANADDHAGGTNAGSAYVFVRQGTTWTQQAKLIAGDATGGDTFGISVSLDGDTAVVGAWQDDHAGGTDAGSAYVFVRNGTIWTQQAKLTADDAAAFNKFGVSVSIDGNTVVAGARDGSSAGVLNAGSAYVFIRNGTIWTQQAKLTASDAQSFDWFGFSTSIDTDTAVIGTHRDMSPNVAGSAYVFVRSGSAWSQQAKLSADDGTVYDFFGSSASIHGERVVVGAFNADHAGGTNAGSAYTFVRNGSSWMQEAKLTADDATNNVRLGYSVSISNDIVIAGTPLDSGNGAAYAFVLHPDDDGDGVFDWLDVCPNNAPGLPVCANGRPQRDCNGDCLYNAADIPCLVAELLGS